MNFQANIIAVKVLSDSGSGAWSLLRSTGLCSRRVPLARCDLI
jgi:hypothetical protein